MKIRYIGTGAFDERDLTGHSVLWQPDQLSEVTDAYRLSKLTSAYGFVTDDESIPGDVDVKAVINPVTGVIRIPVLNQMDGAGVQATAANFDIFDSYNATNRRKLSLPNPYSAVGADLVHPSVVFVPEAWNGWRYWIAYTPYPTADSQYENPCIAVSQDGETWTTPSGLTNPLISKPTGGYNADTHLVLSPDGRTMYLAYRERLAGATNKVNVIESADGVTWSSPRTILTGAYGTKDYASPSIFFDQINGRWVCISHNLDGGATYPMQRTVTSGSDIYTGWGADSTITITNPTGGRTFWHSCFMRATDGRVFGLVQDIVNSGSGASGALFAAESFDDGITFAVRQVYADLSHYRPALNLFESDGGEVGIHAWIGRLESGQYSIKREDWKLGAAEKAFRDFAAQLSVAATYPASVLWFDNFNRADGAIGTPAVGSALTVDTGTFTVASNKIASGSAGNNRAMTGVASADHVVESVFSAGPGASWLIFRGVDVSNYYRVGINGAMPNGLTIQSIVGGAVGALNRLVVSPFGSSTLNAGFKVRVVCRGRRFRIYVNDVLWEEIQDSLYYATGVKVGLSGTNAGVAFDYLLAMA